MSATLLPEKCIAQLQTDTNCLHNMYVLHGAEALQQQEVKDAVRQAARTVGFADRHVFTVQGPRFDWSEIQGAASSMGLFAEKQIVEINLPTGKPGKEGGQALQDLASLAEQEKRSGDIATLFIISIPSNDYTIAKSAWYKTLTKTAVTVQINDIQPNALPRWIAQRLNQQGHTVPNSEEGQHILRYFAQCVEGNLLAAQQAIDKLALATPQGEIHLDDVVASTSNMARFNTADLSEIVLTGQVRRCQHMLAAWQAAGEQPHGIHWVLGGDIYNLYRIRVALDSGEPMPMAMKSVRVWGSKQRLYERAVQKLSLKYMRHMLAGAHIVDGILKGITHPDWPQNSWQAFSRLGLTFTQKLAN